MTAENKLHPVLVKANLYVMPAVDDYMAARCLLLNNILRGLVLGHESIEKILKALLILEKVSVPKSCHSVVTLGNLLFMHSKQKYAYLMKNSKGLARLDKHYGWRYFDGTVNKRSISQSTAEIHLVDLIFLSSHDRYLEFVPTTVRGGSYLVSHLLAPTILNNFPVWSVILLSNNKLIQKRNIKWRKKYYDYYTPNK